MSSPQATLHIHSEILSYKTNLTNSFQGYNQLINNDRVKKRELVTSKVLSYLKSKFSYIYDETNNPLSHQSGVSVKKYVDTCSLFRNVPYKKPKQLK